jgi:hypothetical protein
MVVLSGQHAVFAYSKLKLCQIVVLSGQHAVFAYSKLKLCQIVVLSGQHAVFTYTKLKKQVPLVLIIKPTGCTNFSNLFLE